MKTVATLIALLSFSAAAGEWSDSFPPAAVATYFEGANRSVLVVPAGEPLPPARLAAAALESSLRACGKVGRVADASALDVTGLDDEQIVKASAAQSVEIIAVVRVFEVGSAAPPNAVITFYDKQGAAHLAFSAAKGKAMSANVGSGVDVGVTSPVADAVPSSPEAKHQYEEQYIWFDPYLGTSFTFANQGRRRIVLEGTEFYAAVGRDDLIRLTDARRWFKLSLVWLGLSAVTAAGVMLVMELAGNPCVKVLGSEGGPCLQHAHPDLLVPAAVVGGAGVGLFVLGLALPRFNISQAEAVKIADEYNRALKAKLAPTTDTPAPPPPPPTLTLGFTPVVSPHGLGVALGGTF